MWKQHFISVFVWIPLFGQCWRNWNVFAYLLSKENKQIMFRIEVGQERKRKREEKNMKHSLSKWKMSCNFFSVVLDSELFQKHLKKILFFSWNLFSLFSFWPGIYRLIFDRNFMTYWFDWLVESDWKMLFAAHTHTHRINLAKNVFLIGNFSCHNSLLFVLFCQFENSIWVKKLIFFGCCAQCHLLCSIVWLAPKLNFDAFLE